MSCNTKYTWKCLLDGIGVFTYAPTTTSTTIDSICYLVDCDGNYIVDCECNNIVGCPCTVSTSTTSTPASTSTSTSTSSSSTSTSTSSSTSSSSTSSTSSSSTSTSSTSSTAPLSPMAIPEGAGIVSFGDSITTDNYVPGGLPFLYTSLLTSALGVISTRYAQGGTGYKSMMRFIHQGCDGINCETLNSPMTPNTNVVTELYGLNNVYYEASKTNNLPIVRHGMNALLSIQWASTIVNAANSAITRTGTFTDYLAKTNIICGRFGTTGAAIPNSTNAIYSNTPGSFIEYTATFKHAFVALIGSCGQFSFLPRGIVNIYVDNILNQTVNLGEQYPSPWADAGSGFGNDTETIGPVVLPIIMPSSASRTIKVELVSGDMAIDYISILNTPAAAYPVVLGEIPYVNPDAITYPPGWGPNGGSPAVADTYSSQKQTIVNTWAAQGFPIRYCDTNTYYNYVNTTDGTHPNVLGNQQIKNAFRVLFV